MLWPWTPKARKRAKCFHHDRPAWTKGEVDSRSYIRETIIDMGTRKAYVCDQLDGGCGKIWFG